MTTSKKRENPTTFLRRQVSTNSKGKVLFLDNTVTLSIVPPKEELSNRHSTMETSGKAGIPKWVPMKRIPWQFSQNSSLQLFGEPAIRPFILYNQIKGTRQTSIVIPKKSLSSRHCTIENSDKTTLPKWVLTEKIPWTIIIIVMLHLRSSLERWYLLCSNIFRHPKTKCLETGKWKNGFNGVPPVADLMGDEGTKDYYTGIPTTCFPKKIRKRKHAWNLKYRID